MDAEVNYKAHALKSRLLRGVVPIHTSTRPLGLLRETESETEGERVGWGVSSRLAEHLWPRFEGFGLDENACRLPAAVVVPEFRSEHERWRQRLQRVGAAFDVELVTVPERFARAGLLR